MSLQLEKNLQAPFCSALTTSRKIQTRLPLTNNGLYYFLWAITMSSTFILHYNYIFSCYNSYPSIYSDGFTKEQLLGNWIEHFCPPNAWIHTIVAMGKICLQYMETLILFLKLHLLSSDWSAFLASEKGSGNLNLLETVSWYVPKMF